MILSSGKLSEVENKLVSTTKELVETKTKLREANIENAVLNTKINNIRNVYLLNR
jgi:regulator of replication initiation timing